MKNLTAIQKRVLASVAKNKGGGLERFLMDKEEITAANELVKMGLLRKGTAEVGGVIYIGVE